jgi:hypothetical protein
MVSRRLYSELYSIFFLDNYYFYGNNYSNQIKEGFKMNKIWGVFIVLIIMVLFAMTLYWTRYQVVGWPSGMYRINRLTGETTYFFSSYARDIKYQAPFNPAEAPGAPAPEKPVDLLGR